MPSDEEIEAAWHAYRDVAFDADLIALEAALEAAEAVRTEENTKLKEENERLRELLKEHAPMDLLRLKLEQEQPDYEYEVYTARRKCSDTEGYEDWECIEFERGDYTEQMLYRRKKALEE